MDNEISLIVGYGLIGRSLSELISRSSSVIIAHRKAHKNNPDEIYLDLKDLSSFSCPKNIKVAYICASITNKNYCEENLDESYLVNVTNTLELIKKLNEKNIFVVFLSSVEVFPGDRKKYSVKDNTGAKSVYGKFKEEVERKLINNPKCSIIRMTKVFSKTTPLILSWKYKLSKGEVITAIENVFISPVSSHYAAEKIYSIGINKISGIFHISGSDDISYLSLLNRIKLKYKYSKKESQIARQAVNNMPRYASLSMRGSKEKAQGIDSVIEDII